MDYSSSKDKYFFKKINSEELKNDNFALCKSSLNRSNLIFNFFSSLEGLKISRRHKERSLIMFDKFYNQFYEELSEFSNPPYLKIFLLALLDISIKLEDRNESAKNILEKILLNCHTKIKKSQSEENNQMLLCNIKLSNIYSTEIFLLNKMEWNIELTIFSEFTDFFISYYFEKLFNLIKKEDFLPTRDNEDVINFKEKFLLFINFFTECALSAFDLSYVPKHSISLIIILLSLDQIKPFIINSIKKPPESMIIVNFDKKLKIILFDLNEKYEVDFLRVDNYKKILLDYLEENGVNVVKNYPDENLKCLIQNENSNLKKYFKKSKISKSKNLLKKYSSFEIYSKFDFEKDINLNLANSKYNSTSKFNTESSLSSYKFSPKRKIFQLENDNTINFFNFEKNYFSQNMEISKFRKTNFKEDSKNFISLPVLEKHCIMRKSKSMENPKNFNLLQT
jgi:hypothetical protein